MAARGQEGQGDVVGCVRALGPAGLKDEGVVDGQQDLVDLGAIAAPVQARVGRVHREVEDETQLWGAVDLGPVRVDLGHGHVAQVARHVRCGISVTRDHVLEDVAVLAVRGILRGAACLLAPVEVEAAKLPHGRQAVPGALALGAPVRRADEQAGLHARLEHGRDAELVAARVDVARLAEAEAFIGQPIAVVVEAVADFVARQAGLADLGEAASVADQLARRCALAYATAQRARDVVVVRQAVTVVVDGVAVRVGACRGPGDAAVDELSPSTDHLSAGVTRASSALGLLRVVARI